MPKESLAPAFILDNKGVRIPWKILAIVLAVLAGAGGGSFGLQALLGESASADDLQNIAVKNDAEHKEIQGTLQVQQEATSENAEAIKKVTATVGKIESVQTRDIARKEARRLTDDLRNRRQAEAEYDRLFEQNLRRMARGMDPCGTLACE